MTGWYDPVRLLSIGIRVAEATVFGKMFYRRELIAALDPFERPESRTTKSFSGSRLIATENSPAIRSSSNRSQRPTTGPC
jgi:hypothetical protein